MKGDAKRGDDLAVFEMTCKRFQNWFAKQRLPPFKEAVMDAWMCCCTSMIMADFGVNLIRFTCLCKKTILAPSPRSQFLSPCGQYKPLVEIYLAKDLCDIAHNIILMRVCNASISYVMKNIRGKEDLETSIVAGFGYGVAVSLANGMRGPSVLSVGVVWALFNGGMFKAGIKMPAYDHKLDRFTWRR
ncbi:uncharacterized protein LOC110887275 isoform X1 [Helianthus annuus]|uniref:uncharacterized protein LOC110887275 isoform X1 n=2 Tax=Helianthus annuus TaxID=4232 RepID=UPI000B8F737E|nr:uncharacterized protein LOC110887275 isoform X1 [Helianthus annuus]